LIIVQAVLFFLGGIVISLVGVSEVFVPEDLAFMRTTAQALGAINPRLIPLVAHDRASLGAMLVVSGLAFLQAALWGYRRGEFWLWWTLLLASLPGFLATLAVHFAVGYTNLYHLTPTFLGVVLFTFGLALSYPYLRGRDAKTTRAWAELRKLKQAQVQAASP
jgi:hypothetical protein